MFTNAEITLLIKKYFSDDNIEIQAIEKMALFYRFLHEQNKLFNLTGIKESDALFFKNFLDILFVVKLNKELKGRAIDIGSGAGLPGMLLSILYPKLYIDSIDTKHKKIDFQNEIKSKLSLDRIQPVQTQIIEWNERNYDLLVCRAFKNLNTIFQFAQYLVKRGGAMILWKGQNWQNEWDAIPKTLQSRFIIEQNYRYEIEDGLYGGNLLEFKKVK